MIIFIVKNEFSLNCTAFPRSPLAGFFVFQQFEKYISFKFHNEKGPLTNEVGGLGVDDELAHLELGGVVRLECVSSGQRLLVDRGLLQRLVEQPLHVGGVDRVAEVRQLHEVVNQDTALTTRQQQYCDENNIRVAEINY